MSLVSRSQIRNSNFTNSPRAIALKRAPPLRSTVQIWPILGNIFETVPDRIWKLVSFTNKKSYGLSIGTKMATLDDLKPRNDRCGSFRSQLLTEARPMVSATKMKPKD